MTDRKPGPPLFELLRDQPDPDDHHSSSHPHESAGSSPQSTHGSQVSADEQHELANGSRSLSAGVSRAERSAATMPEEPMPGDSGVQVPMSRVYMIIAIMGIALVLVWTLAYRMGVERGKDEMSNMVQQNQPLVMPPSSDPGTRITDSSNSAVDSNTNQPSNTTPTSTSGSTSEPVVTSQSPTAIMTSRGYVEVDPRASGKNYLQLATLDTEQAADAVLFMRDQGVAIIGVPMVDSGVRRGNNPTRYTLYSIGLAVPGGAEFRQMQTQRQEHTRLIAELGARWQRERRGGSDFAENKTQWVKYN